MNDRYFEISVPVGSSNVNRVTFLACKDCGVLVCSKVLHDKHHDEPNT